jgi:hypothetical protein
MFILNLKQNNVYTKPKTGHVYTKLKTGQCLCKT